MEVIKSLFAAALLLSLPLSLAAEPRSAFKSSVRAASIEKILQQNKSSYELRGNADLPSREKAQGHIHFRVPGVGLVRFHAKRFRNVNWQSVLLTASGEREFIDPKMQLLQGHVSLRTREGRVNRRAAASVEELSDGNKRFLISFPGGEKRKLYYETELVYDPAQLEQRVTAVTRRFPHRKLGENSCGVSAAHAGHDEHSPSMYEGAALVAASSTLQAEIKPYADAPFVERYGSSGAASRITSIMNTVDQIYNDQLGIDLVIEGTTLYTSATEPFSSFDNSLSYSDTGSSESTQFLQAFASLSSVADHHHLFTGRLLAEQTFGVVGLAYVGGVCSSNGSYGLSQDISGQSAAVMASIAAHEIGHNFGASHTTQNCSSGGDSLMEASLSLGSPSSCFSSDSSSVIKGTAQNASCISSISSTPTPSASPSPSPSASASSSPSPSSSESPSPSPSGDDGGSGSGGGGGGGVEPTPTPDYFVTGTARGKNKVRIRCSVFASESGAAQVTAPIEFQRRDKAAEGEAEAAFEEFSLKFTTVRGIATQQVRAKRKQEQEVRCAFEETPGEYVYGETFTIKQKRRVRKKKRSKK